MFRQQAGPKSIVDDMHLDLLVASGGVLSHAPRTEQTAAMLIDAFEPRGFTNLAKDSIFMMPHLGVLAEVHPAAALQVFERDCLIRLGVCLAVVGEARTGREAFEYQIDGPSLSASGVMRFGELRRFRLGATEQARVAAVPRRGFDLGAGVGRRVEREVAGGTVGLILDARGRPLRLPAERAECQRVVGEWAFALEEFPGRQEP